MCCLAPGAPWVRLTLPTYGESIVVEIPQLYPKKAAPIPNWYPIILPQAQLYVMPPTLNDVELHAPAALVVLPHVRLE